MRAQTKSLPKQKSQTTMTASNAVGNKRRKKTQTKRLDWETQRNRSTAHNRAGLLCECWCLYAHARCLCMSAAHLIFIRIWSTNCGFIFITRTINTPNKPTEATNTQKWVELIAAYRFVHKLSLIILLYRHRSLLCLCCVYIFAWRCHRYTNSMREQHILVIFGIFFGQCWLLLLLCVESTTRWMLTCDSIFQIIDMEMKLNKFFLPFSLSLSYSIHIKCPRFLSTPFSFLDHIEREQFMYCISFSRFNSLNAHFMSKIVNWHESKASYCIMQPSTIWLHPFFVQIISHSFWASYHLKLSVLLLEMKLNSVSHAFLTLVSFNVGYKFHSKN